MILIFGDNFMWSIHVLFDLIIDNVGFIFQKTDVNQRRWEDQLAVNWDVHPLKHLSHQARTVHLHKWCRLDVVLTWRLWDISQPHHLYRILQETLPTVNMVTYFLVHWLLMFCVRYLTSCITVLKDALFFCMP